MHEQITTLYERVAAWFGQAQDRGWLDATDIQALRQVEQRTPAELFTDARVRPMVVAFFGGTGVGKSSLLNRLAGEPIARVGVERPTSHEITVYVHEDVELATLPEEFPLQQVHIARHADEARRTVLWVDMPDIDSTELGNRQLALAWLAYVDLLVYVVSPERYRDDVGWRVLRERGHRHGWMFIINHWDEGAPEQLTDLTTTLQGAGFRDPLVLRTCCGNSPCPDDQFAELETAIRELQARHGQLELERLGHRARLQDLAATLQDALQRLGRADTWQEIHSRFQEEWTRAGNAVLDGMTWPIQEFAAEFASREARPITRLLGGRSGPSAEAKANRPSRETVPGVPASVTERQAAALWDAWAHSRMIEAIDALEIALRHSRVTPQPLLQRLQQVTDHDSETVNRQVQQCLRQGLARPGTALQRALRRLSGAALTLLPGAALLWAAWHVVHGYLQGTSRQAEFLGANFAINSILLVLVAWLVPWLLHHRLRPSTEKTVQRALHKGLELGLQALSEDAETAFAKASDERSLLLEDAERISTALDAVSGAGLPAPDTSLARLVADGRSPEH